MTDKYVLYLDESIDDEQFAIAGFAINEEQLNNLSEEILDLKKQIWDEESIERFHPILHSTQLNHLYQNKNNSKRVQKFSGPYSKLAAKTKEEIQKDYDTVYGRLSKILKDLNITTFCCFVDSKKIEKLYKTGTPFLTTEDKYDIAIHAIIECYCHFLCSVKGVGSIIYESRNNSLTWNEKTPDAMMLSNFCKTKVNSKGISIFPDIEKNKRLIQFHF